MIALLDQAIADLQEARSAWKRGYSSRCIRCLFDAIKRCKDAVHQAAEEMVS